MDDQSHADLPARGGGDCAPSECMEREQGAEATPSSRSKKPFVWQRGRRLLLLEWELGAWVLAEMEFDPRLCRYAEVRRAFYRWEREAIGALLSRTIAYGDHVAAESADRLESWIRHRR